MARFLLPISMSALLLLAATAQADRLILAVEQDLTSQSNLFKTEEEEESDVYYRVRPSVRLLGDGRAIRYDVFYRPSLDFYFDNSDLNDDSHYGRGELSWAPVPTGELTLGGELSHYRSVRADDVDADGIPEVVPGGQGRITKAVAKLGYEQRVQRDWIAAARADLQSYTFSGSNSTDNFGYGGETSLLHELRSNLALGGSLFGSQRFFDEQENSGTPRSRNVVVNGSLVLRAEPIRAVTLEIQGGPALVAVYRDRHSGATVNRFRGSGTGANTVAAIFDPARCSQVVGGQFLLDGCPTESAPDLAGQLGERVGVDFDPGTRPEADDDVEVTGFVRALLRRDDSWGYTSIAYSRWEEGSAGISATAIRDSVTGTLQVEPRDWILRLRANWNRREDVTRTVRSAVRAGPSPVQSAGPFFVAEATGLVPVSATPRITQYWFDVQITRPFWDDRLALELGGRYVVQKREGFGESVEFDNLIGTVGIRYEFRPLHYLE